MKPLGEMSVHVMKVRSMAKSAGADLGYASESGALTQEEWAGMVWRCRACEWDEGCARFLARTCGETPVDVPECCVNRQHLMALVAQTGETL